MRPVALLGLVLWTASCSLPEAVASLEDHAPDPDLGRPVAVRNAASVGAWLGGSIGAVLSIATLPVTWLITTIDEEPFGQDRSEFLWAPVSIGAGAGQFLVGAPIDSLDFVLRRAWTADGPIDIREQPAPARPSAGIAGAGARP
jgi:hypothetical protein